MLFSEKERIELGLACGAVFGGVESARIALKNLQRLAVIVRVEAGTGTTFSGTLRQHDAASGGNSKDLGASIPHYYKADGDTEFTKVDADEATPAKAIAALDTVAGYVVFEVDPSDLDVNNGFNHVSLVLPASGTARDGSVTYSGCAKYLPAYESTL